MAEYVRMPKADYVAACNSIRAKTGKSDVIKSGAMSAEIDNITGGGGTSGDDRVKYVTFMDGAIELYKQPVIAGDTCKDPYANNLISVPTKESTAQYDYTFNGWSLTDGGSANSTALQNVTSDRTVYAAFKATARKYTITWLDEDGTTLNAEQWAYGTVPSYTPTKEGVTFDKWTPTPVAVTGDASYTASWSSMFASGQCGDNLTWVLRSTGELVISGTGAMADFTYGSTPWHEYLNQIVSVQFPDGLTKIGNNAFILCSTLTDAPIPNTVKTIGNQAFKMTGLASVTIPSSVETVGYGAFFGTQITSFTFPASVTSWGYDAFRECSKLTNVTIEDGVTIIPSTAFYYCIELQDIIIPDSVTIIGSSAFYGCRKLVRVVIGAGVTTIVSFAFNGCNNLTNADFGNTSGWYVTKTSGASSGTNVSVTNRSAAAQYLRDTYDDYYWYRS